MKTTPVILGAIALAIGAGTALGMTTPTNPLRSADDTLAALPKHAMESRSLEEAREMVAKDDQYALETPQGRVEVAELAFHGRLRDRRRDVPLYGARTEAEAYGMDTGPSYAEALDAQQPQQLAAAEPMEAAFVPLEEGIFERVAVREIPARQARFEQRDRRLEGQARVINVEAELAARN